MILGDDGTAVVIMDTLVYSKLDTLQIFSLFLSDLARKFYSRKLVNHFSEGFN